MATILDGSYFRTSQGFPGGTVVKNLPANARDAREVGLIPGLGRSPGGGNSNTLQYSYLENTLDRGAWWATVHGGHKKVDTTWQLNSKVNQYIRYNMRNLSSTEW